MSLRRDRMRGRSLTSTLLFLGLFATAAMRARADGCSSDTALCLSGGRFVVVATWTKPDGSTGAAHAVALTADSGYFWFSEPGNIELAVKMLNGCSANERFWFFSAGLTNLGIRIHVSDTTTNASRDYSNPVGTAFQTVADTNAFAACPAGGAALGNPEAPRKGAPRSAPTVSPRIASAGCATTDGALCLNGRFRVEASWQTSSGQQGAAHATALTSEAGYFWFFDSSNVELLVKGLDACSFAAGNWFFAAGMTNAGVQVKVTDTLTGRVQNYATTAGATFAPIQDTAAFPYCPSRAAAWPQWGQNSRHDGAAPVIGQSLQTIYADVVCDPFVSQQIAEIGVLLTHYAVPLVEGSDVYMETKSGTYVACDPPGSGQPFPCGPDAWGSQTWNVVKLSWVNGALVQRWTFASDWKPEPTGGNLGDWEPVFLPVLTADAVYVPGSGGSVHKVAKSTGSEIARVTPFADLNPNRYVAGGLAAGADGSVFYDALQLDASDAWGTDAVDGWLVRVRPDGTATALSFHDLTPGAPAPTDACQLDFLNSERPWPPTPTAQPQSSACGSQRPGINVVPAVAPDGTIYAISRAHFNERYAYVVAVHPDMTPAWASSMRNVLNDGCGVLVPIDDAEGCRSGATIGVDPRTNDRPAGRVIDRQTSSPAVLPDGAILYGSKTFYNQGNGHLFKLSPAGEVLATYPTGFDSTPAVFPHDGTYSIVVKHNFGEYYLVSLDANLSEEWTFENPNTESCVRNPDGTVTCTDDKPDGFEWCVNQPAVDAAGTTYANSDDGRLYAIDRSGNLRDSIFLDVTLGAAYTPVAIGGDGRLYAQNSGHLIVVGNAPPP